MAEPEDQSGFNLADGKMLRFCSTEMPQVVSSAEPAQDSVVTG